MVHSRFPRRRELASTEIEISAAKYQDKGKEKIQRKEQKPGRNCGQKENKFYVQAAKSPVDRESFPLSLGYSDGKHFAV